MWFYLKKVHVNEAMRLILYYNMRSCVHNYYYNIMWVPTFLVAIFLMAEGPTVFYTTIVRVLKTWYTKHKIWTCTPWILSFRRLRDGIRYANILFLRLFRLSDNIILNLVIMPIRRSIVRYGSALARIEKYFSPSPRVSRYICQSYRFF